MVPYVNLTNKNRVVDFIVEYRTCKSASSFLKKYNLISNADGSIYDHINKKQFSCLYTWAKTILGK